MVIGRITLAAMLLVINAAPGVSVSGGKCSTPNAMQILGSGGPVAEGHRAGSSAVIWQNSKAVLLIDAGSGAFVRYGQAGVKFADHKAILITHFHGDHVADLAAILNNGGFANRREPLPIIGPAGNAEFPGVAEHLDALLNEKSGAFRYLSGYLDGRFELPQLQPQEIDVGRKGLQTIIVGPDMRISAISVHHGEVPALGFLIEANGKKIVFSGDQSFLSDDFVGVLKGLKPDILVMHNVIPEGEGQPRGLHRWPASIGEAASAISPSLLVLSHNMQRALSRQDEGEAAIRQHYKGEMRVADDLDCFVL